jgi:WD repeat-containing protein 70
MGFAYLTSRTRCTRRRRPCHHHHRGLPPHSLTLSHSHTHIHTTKQQQTAQRRAAEAERGGGRGEDGAAAADLRSHFPAGFGGGGGGAAAFDLGDGDDGDGDGDDGDYDAPPTTGAGGLKRGRDEDEDEGDEAEEDEEEDDSTTNPFALPTSHEALLAPTPRSVGALALDGSGAYLLAGARDGTLQLFDFGSMAADLGPRRTLVPRPDHPITGLAWAPGAAAFAVAASDARIAFYDRDGRAAVETVRGDPYLRDAKHTAGHTAPVTALAWHPTDASTAASASEDGTVRLWCADTGKQRTVIKPTLARPGRVGVTALAYGDGEGGGGGSVIVAGLEDGSLHAWDVRASGRDGGAGTAASIGGLVPPPREQMTLRPDWRVVAGPGGGGGGSGGTGVAERVATAAHAPWDGEGGGAITGLALSPAGSGPPRLASRGGCDGGSLKVWDLRALGGPRAASTGRGGSAPAPAPLLALTDLAADVPGTGVAWSPDGRLVLAAVSAGGRGEGGAVVFADTRAAGGGASTTDPIVRRLALPPGCSAVSLAWHARLNQVFVGAGTPREGGVRVLFSPKRSARGVLAAAGRPVRRPDPADWAPPPLIYAPNALRAFQEDIPGLPAHLRPRKAGRGGGGGGGGGAGDAAARAGPVPPVGAGGGKPAPTRPARTLLRQHLLAGQGALRPAGAGDVREAMLRHGRDAGLSVGPKILAAAVEEEEEEEGDGE